MDYDTLQKLFEKEPLYRLKQAKNSVFGDLIEIWQEATVFPLILRQKLNEKYPLEIKAEILTAKDQNSVKAVLTLEDGLRIESVLLRHKDGRNTVCVSSQVGCPVCCSFCATGKMGFKRNLEVGEIASQVLMFARYLKGLGQKVTGVVFMGMGEPFLNYDEVMKAIRILNDKNGFNLGARHFCISTVGIIEGIEKLSDEKLQVNLAVSLHAPDDKLRSELVPVNEKYPIKKIIDAVDSYIKKTRRRVMFEYLMIDGLNDSPAQAENLVRLMKRPLYFINLISYNSTGEFKPSSAQRMKKFKEILKRGGVEVTQRYRFGREIKGACGQLAARAKK